jgi:predicted RNA binding protein YcfA (HicA-like mRNA interferase family)
MTPRAPVVSGRQCIRVLARAGFRVVRQRGSHVRLRNDETGAWVSVPLHKELRPGTFHAIRKAADLCVEDFRRLP